MPFPARMCPRKTCVVHRGTPMLVQTYCGLGMGLMLRQGVRQYAPCAARHVADVFLYGVMMQYNLSRGMWWLLTIRVQNVRG